MPPVEDEIHRLKNLLASGKSLTESARIMDISRSKAQRLKKKIVESSDVTTEIDLKWGRLENATTLTVKGNTMVELIDWSKTIFLNDANIFQKKDDYWIVHPLGDIIYRLHGIPKELSKTMINVHLREVLSLPKIDRNGGYRDHRISFFALFTNWYSSLESLLRAKWTSMARQGDLRERHLTNYTVSYDLIVDSVIERAKVLEVDPGFILQTMVLQLNSGKGKADLIDSIKKREIVNPNSTELFLHYLKEDKVFPSPDQLTAPVYNISDEVVHEHFTDEQILSEYTDLSQEIIDFMIEQGNFDSEDIELMKFGGINDIDLEFAKKGGFKTASAIELARDLKCTSLQELDTVVENGWDSGDEMRNAIHMYGVGPNCRQQYLNMVEMNPQVNWTGEWKSELQVWAELADEDDFIRLQGFTHPKAMSFYEDVLMQFDEPSVRTDYLMRDYNEIDAPGDFISDEGDFADLMSSKPFASIVKVGKGGVTQIDFDQRDLQKQNWTPKPKIDASEYRHLSRSRKKAAKELQVNLLENVLDKSLTGAYDWLISNLKTKMGIGKKDEFLPIDELRDMLRLDKTAVNNLHEARLARNFVAHPFEAEEKEPTWLMVALCLECAERVLNYEH